MTGSEGGDYSTLEFPPGLEDLHIESRTGNGTGTALLWTLTEFHPRAVFVADLDNLVYP